MAGVLHATKERGGVGSRGLHFAETFCRVISLYPTPGALRNAPFLSNLPLSPFRPCPSSTHTRMHPPPPRPPTSSDPPPPFYLALPWGPRRARPLGLAPFVWGRGSTALLLSPPPLSGGGGGCHTGNGKYGTLHNRTC